MQVVQPMHTTFSFCVRVVLTLLVTLPLPPYGSHALLIPICSLGDPFRPFATGLLPMPTYGHLARPTNRCPRPYDQYGPRYQTVMGTFIARQDAAPGGPGGKFVLIQAPSAAAPLSEAVTDTVFELLGAVQPGVVITLFGYVISSMAGAQAPYSCVEIAGRSAP